MGRKIVGFLTVVLIAVGSLTAGLAAPAPAKEETVTLAVSGMSCASCVSTIESAIKAVKGVKEVKVSLQEKEAVVTFDADEAKVDDLIKAVKEAKGMNSYEASVKQK
jgi:mercuric ion binding protein